MKDKAFYAERIIESRIREFGRPCFDRNVKPEEEGGCGVTGFASNVQLAGRHIFEPSVRMHNRGNGKGGGIAAVGLNPKRLRVSQDELDSHYMIQAALLEPGCLGSLRETYIKPYFDVKLEEILEHVSDTREIKGLEVKPPEVWRTFVRVKPEVLDKFIKHNNLEGIDPRHAEEEFISRNSFRINKDLYSSLGEKRAFVLSHGRNVMILKIVGYAEHIVQYYMLEDFEAHAWIAHQRYPTRGRVWHPGGAHPFSGMNEALVHNGDFANYHATSDYLKQRGMEPLFMTDTEVSVQLFDLWNRVYGYPLEVIIEALAPTGELDFDLLPSEKQALYSQVQNAHIHASPDGPWFFIIARNVPETKSFQLIGITDTAMLRPQVFALYDGEVQIGLICSEKQAIDATLRSIANEDPRYSPVADKYWNARGGSVDDGGAFMFTISPDENGTKKLVCQNKFGQPVSIEPRTPLNILDPVEKPTNAEKEILPLVNAAVVAKSGQDIYELLKSHGTNWDYNTIRWVVGRLGKAARSNSSVLPTIIEGLTLAIDRRFPLGAKKRSATKRIVIDEINEIFRSIPKVTNAVDLSSHALIDFETRHYLRPPIAIETTLVVDGKDFEPEGPKCSAFLVSDAYTKGWKNFVIFDLRGQRFDACGFGPKTEDVRIDLYGSSGDYAASGIDGMEVHIHGNAQDQIGQIMKRGTLVIHGDTGQCFLYGAKGGDTFVLGNAAGRPLINAAGKPRAVINGTALDFLAESFMAGDPLNGGGFVIVNGLTQDEDGNIIYLDRPYPGSNLFSLASGGALYIRDPHKVIVDEQLNGGKFAELTEEDWNVILPYLEKNERYFGITVDELLTVDGVRRSPKDVYRKVEAVPLAVLQKIPSTDDSVWASKAISA